jgi:lipopolysaccharide export LptBFGC system permease protein LptF
MHEDGELIALAAGGISPARITWLCMPVMLVTLAAVGYIAHTIMPEAYLRTRQEQAALVQRALAAKINRQEPLYNKDGLTILAGGATDNSLKDVVIWQTNADGDFVALTTAAWWRAQTLPGATSIQLLLEQSDFLYQDADDGSMVSGQVNGLTYEDIRQLPDLGDKPDGQNAAVLHENLTLLTAMRRAVGEPDFPQSSWQNQRTALLAAALTAAKPAPTHLQWSDLSRPQQLLSDLASTSTDPAFLAQCRVALPKLALQQLRAQSLAESSTNRALQNTILKTLEGQRAQAPIPAWLTKANDVSDRDDITSWIALEQAVPLTTAALPVAQVVNDWRYRVARLREQQPEARLASINKRLQRELRANQFAWHMRWGMTFGVVVYWLFGCGIALQLGKANRMIAVGLGIAVVVATLVPAMVAVKGLRGNLAISPGYVLWVPLTLIALYSFRLQRRYR